MSALGMPPHMLALFEARPPLEHLPFPDTKLRRKPGGMAEYVKEFLKEVPVPPPHFETPKERRARKNKEKLEAHLNKQKILISEYDPKSGNSLTHDPYKTLFIGNLAYEATERQLRNEFETYGKIKRIRIIADANGKPRGYAFMEFDSERDMVNAYKRGDGRKIAGRRVIVDVERARTVAGWLPRRLGGGRGLARGVKKNVPPPLPNSNSSSSRGYQNTNRSYSQSRPKQSNHYGYNSGRNGYSARSSSFHPERRDYNDYKHDNSRSGSIHYGDRGSYRRDRSYEREYHQNEKDYKKHHN